MLDVRLFSVRSSFLENKTVSAPIPAKFDLVNIALIDWKDPANSRPAGTIDKTTSAFCQHGAGKEKIAAGAALTAGPLADKELVEHIFLAELNEIPAPEFADHMNHATRILDCAFEKGDPLPDEIRQLHEMVEYIVINVGFQRHDCFLLKKNSLLRYPWMVGQCRPWIPIFR